MSANPAFWAAHIATRYAVPVGARLSDLQAVALQRGCSVESQTVPGESGRTFRDDTGWHIWLDEQASYRRNRFTLAHELGHLVIGQTAQLSGLSFVRNKVERWCDHFAAELLMPRAFLHDQQLPKHEIGLEGIDRVANDCKVTRSAAIVRLNELGFATVATLTFRHLDDRWVLYTTSCLSRELRECIRSASGTSVALAALTSDGGIAKLRLPLLITGHEQTVNATAAKSKNYITVALSPRDLSAAASRQLGRTGDSSRA